MAVRNYCINLAARVTLAIFQSSANRPKPHLFLTSPCGAVCLLILIAMARSIMSDNSQLLNFSPAVLLLRNRKATKKCATDPQIQNIQLVVVALSVSYNAPHRCII